MIRLHALVEGQTEEAFFNRLLVPHLWSCGIQADVQLINPRTGSTSRRTKGGWNSYQVIRRHLSRWMGEDHGNNVWFTTMVDLYAIPRDFPKHDEAIGMADPFRRVDFLEQAWRDDVVTDGRWRFIPYVQLHEFEALLLADPAKLDWEFLEHEAAIERLAALSTAFETPELIDDGPETAPSKRIIREIPEYGARKTSVGPLVADKIGLATLRARCPHFDAWIKSLEDIAGLEEGRTK
ncbi:MAG TPA: DUF4276 family protein [Arenibaculum sp.]|nr:DUF4276 family protein [Arenibaculum sp.]